MKGWDELVTTALLGTDRRPLPEGLSPAWSGYDHGRAAHDPAGVVLDLAASHRALRQAGTPLGVGPAMESGPSDRLPLAPARAQDVLAALGARPEPGLVNLWLAICVAQGLGVAAELWPRLAQLASRNAAYDRALLVRAVGPQGVWFLRQNPAWARLPEATETAAASSATDPDAALAAIRSGASPSEAMEQILSCADPLPHLLVGVALRIIAGGMLGPETRQAARSIGHRIPPDVWATLPGELTGDALSDSGPRSPVAQLSLTVIQRAVEARSEIEAAFHIPIEKTTS